MKKNIFITIIFIMCSTMVFSQNLKFADTPNLVIQDLGKGNAFVVEQQNIIVPKYKNELIDNPLYLQRIELIDSLQGRIDQLKQTNFWGTLKKEANLSTKKNKKEIEISELEKQITLLKRDIPPRNGVSTYSYDIPKKVYGYVPTGEMQRNILIVKSSKNVSNVLKGDIFNRELTLHGNGNLYYQLKKDTLMFKKDELVVKDSIQRYFGTTNIKKLSIEAGYLFKKVNDDSIFLFDKQLKNELISKDRNDFSKLLISLGISLEKSENHSSPVLVKDEKKCVLTPEIKDYLETENKSDIIDKVNHSITQYKNELKKQCDITVKITKYIKMHQSYTKMSNQQLSEWKELTKSAITIEAKMNKLPFYSSIPFQVSSLDNQLHSANLDIILYSKQALGM